MKTLKKRKSNGETLPSFRSNLSELFDIDKIFEEPLFDFPVGKKLYSKVPATNIKEKEGEFLLEIAAPGLDKKDFHVDVDNNVLEVKVEKESETETKEEEDYTRKEYNYNAFYRSFTLPENVNKNEIGAQYKNGILKVQLPKIKKSKKKALREISVS